MNYPDMFDDIDQCSTCPNKLDDLCCHAAIPFVAIDDDDEGYVFNHMDGGEL